MGYFSTIFTKSFKYLSISPLSKHISRKTHLKINVRHFSSKN